MVLLNLPGFAEVVTIGSVSPFSLALQRDWHASPAKAHGSFRLAGATQRWRQAGRYHRSGSACRLIRLPRLLTQRLVLGAGHELSIGIQRRILVQSNLYPVSNNSSEGLASLEQV